MLIPIAAIFTLAAPGICQANDAEWSCRAGYAPFIEQKDSLRSSYAPLAGAKRIPDFSPAPTVFVGEDGKALDAPRSVKLPSEPAPAEVPGTGKQVVRLSETKKGEGNVKPYNAV